MNYYFDRNRPVSVKTVRFGYYSDRLRRLCFGLRVFIYLIYLCIYWFVCMYACYQLFSKTTGPNCMRFSGIICHHPRTNRLDFGSDQARGQGPGHEKVKNVFLS